MREMDVKYSGNIRKYY